MGKKLIEVALPLDIINDASVTDKRPETGAFHPKGLHYYPARLPLPAARAILFASVIDDPSENLIEFPTQEEQDSERSRLFSLIKEIATPKIQTRSAAFKQAKEEINKHCNGNLPNVHDPFSGGGAIPLEGMRLGFNSIATDLNPVSVLLNKINIELLPKYADKIPINPKTVIESTHSNWSKAEGVVEDLRYYGNIIKERITEKLTDLFPLIKHDGQKYKAITYLWARTVKCPNPACGCQMPLIKSFQLRSKKNPKIYFKPIVEAEKGRVEIKFEITDTNPGKGTFNGRSNKATCIACGDSVKLEYIKNEGQNGRIGHVLTVISTDAGTGKKYIPGNALQEQIAFNATPLWTPNLEMSKHPQYMAPPRYGIKMFGDLFTSRQLYSLNLIHDEIHKLNHELIQLHDKEYVNLLTLLLFMASDRLADFNCNVSRWSAAGEEQKPLFSSNRVAMAIDYCEANVIGDKGVCWSNCVNRVAESVRYTLNENCLPGIVHQKNAEIMEPYLRNLLISTDPPYYNNIPYADLMDFFYVWIKKNLEPYFPEITKTLLTPKSEELVANEFRFDGDKEKAKEHFESGFKRVFSVLREAMDDRFPMSIYYAFKQEEVEDESDDEEASDLNDITLTTGWETILEAVVQSGFQITATWPLRASQQWRLRAMGSNALASYIVMICRKRDDKAPSITRRQYIQELKRELPNALEVLQRSNLAPVDLAQAALGPGMGIYSKYTEILEQDGSKMRVRTAMTLINKALDEILTEQEGDFDAETRWALAWFEQFGTSKQSVQTGDPESLCRAKGTALNALVDSGIISAGGGFVKLYAREELPAIWDPTTDRKTVVWEIAQHLIKHLQEKGELGAARLYKSLGSKADVARELAYRLFIISEKKGWAQEAQAYNSLVLSWNQIVAESYNIKDPSGSQTKLFE